MRCLLASLVLLSFLNLTAAAQTTINIKNDRSGQRYSLTFEGDTETGIVNMETDNIDTEHRDAEMSHSYDASTKTDTWVGIWVGGNITEDYTITKNRETGKWTVKLVTYVAGVEDKGSSYDDSATKLK